MVIHTAIRTVRGPIVPKFFGTPYIRRNCLTSRDEIWYGKRRRGVTCC